MRPIRGELVRSFRALCDGKRGRQWNELVDTLKSEMGMITADDSHSILVSLAKGVKNPDVKIHPVAVAPVASTLILKILRSPQAEFRTKAGTFGLIGRLGVDWTKHVPVTQREEMLHQFRVAFQQECESALTDPYAVDTQSFGYCCESAMNLGLESKDFTKLVEERIVNDPFSVSPLATVQISQYLSTQQPNRTVWKQIADRVISDIDSFTPQNLEFILNALTRVGFTSADLVKRASESLACRTSMLRLSDCVSLLESVSLLSGASSNSSLFPFARAMQRRMTILIVTSHQRIRPADVQRISSALIRLMIPPSEPLRSVSSMQPQQRFLLSP